MQLSYECVKEIRGPETRDPRSIAGRGSLEGRLLGLLRFGGLPAGRGVVRLDGTLRARLPHDHAVVAAGFGGLGEPHRHSVTHASPPVKKKISARIRYL